MKEIVLTLEYEKININVFEYERFTEAEKEFLQELNYWIYLEKNDEEPTSK